MASSVRLGKLAILALAAVFGGWPAHAVDAPAWTGDFHQALAEARQSHRAVLIDFSAGWCAPCKQMDRDLWSRPEVIELTRKVIVVRLDFDRQRGLALKQGVSGIPAVIVLDPWGRALARSTGYGDAIAQQIKNLLTNLPTDFAVAAPWVDRVEKSSKDFEALRWLGQFYGRRKFWVVSDNYYERALKCPEAGKDAAIRADVEVASGWNLLHVGDFKKARKRFDAALSGGTKLEAEDTALFGLVMVELMQGHRAEAEKFFARLAAAYPDAESTRVARGQLAAKP
ncbi:MAG TPA: thioredoxin family protein [Thermoanaerobaculia bacterium]|jgi:thioredoxin-like negative regulator of GroEL|nr:thioredoxin family protein [Thermoanaerobaculia bacterium]